MYIYVHKIYTYMCVYVITHGLTVLAIKTIDCLTESLLIDMEKENNTFFVSLFDEGI